MSISSYFSKWSTRAVSSNGISRKPLDKYKRPILLIATGSANVPAGAYILEGAYPSSFVPPVFNNESEFVSVNIQFTVDNLKVIPLFDAFGILAAGNYQQFVESSLISTFVGIIASPLQNILRNVIVNAVAGMTK